MTVIYSDSVTTPDGYFMMQGPGSDTAVLDPITLTDGKQSKITAIFCCCRNIASHMLNWTKSIIDISENILEALYNLLFKKPRQYNIFIHSVDASQGFQDRG